MNRAGGIVVIPMLALLLDIAIRSAMGASIPSLIDTSNGAATAYMCGRPPGPRAGLLLVMPTTTGAATGAFVATVIGTQTLFLILAAVLGYSAFAMLRKRRSDLRLDTAANHPLSQRLRLASAYSDAARGEVIPYNVAGVPLAMVLMYIAGIVFGLLGIGSGALKVPAMDLVMRLPIEVSSATSSFMIGVTAVASAGIYFARGDIVPVIAAPVALGVMIGAMLGAQAMMRMRSTLIRQTFVVILVIIIALQTAIKGLGLRVG